MKVNSAELFRVLSYRIKACLNPRPSINGFNFYSHINKNRQHCYVIFQKILQKHLFQYLHRFIVSCRANQSVHMVRNMSPLCCMRHQHKHIYCTVRKGSKTAKHLLWNLFARNHNILLLRATQCHLETDQLIAMQNLLTNMDY